jgi:hypothetical protein
LERPKLSTRHLRFEVSQTILFFNGKLTFAGYTFGLFSLPHTAPNNASPTE